MDGLADGVAHRGRDRKREGSRRDGEGCCGTKVKELNVFLDV